MDSLGESLCYIFHTLLHVSFCYIFVIFVSILHGKFIAKFIPIYLYFVGVLMLPYLSVKIYNMRYLCELQLLKRQDL